MLPSSQVAMMSGHGEEEWRSEKLYEEKIDGEYYYYYNNDNDSSNRRPYRLHGNKVRIIIHYVAKTQRIL